MNSASIALRIQYAHLDKLHDLPGMTEALPAHFRPGLAEYGDITEVGPSARGTPRSSY
jgi:hypothetical protein